MKKLASKLEEEFQASEQARLKAEENKRRQQTGVPVLGSPQEALEKLSEVEDWLSQISLGKEAFQRISTILVSLKQGLNAKKELKEFSAELTGLFDKILTEIQNLRRDLADYRNDIQPLVIKTHKVRDLQIETLTKLNKYLDNWL